MKPQLQPDVMRKHNLPNFAKILNSYELWKECVVYNVLFCRKIPR